MQKKKQEKQSDYRQKVQTDQQWDRRKNKGHFIRPFIYRGSKIDGL